MSILGFTKDSVKAFLGKFWGGKVKDENGNLRDTGVQEFVEEMVARLSAQQPIILDKPLEIRNKTNGPAIIIYNDGPLTDFMGIRIKDRAGNEVQLGIGLGSEGINANSFIPDPRYAIAPEDQHRFHSNLGGNAGGDRNHPQAVEANNGLIAPLGMVGNFQVPLWLTNLSKQPAFQDDDCHPVYRVDWFSQAVYWPLYVPQSLLIMATADEEMAKGDSGEVSVLTTTYTAHNSLFLCIEEGDLVVIACIGGRYEIIAHEEKELFATGATSEAIPKGGSGSIALDGGGTVTAASPYDSLTCDVKVALNRASACEPWTITASECWDEDACP